MGQNEEEQEQEQEQEQEHQEEWRKIEDRERSKELNST